MEVGNNLNSMYQLENNLNKSAHNISKSTLNDSNVNEVQKSDSIDNEYKNPEIDLAKEMMEQILIPIAYTANAEVISTQASIDKTIIDIKA